MPRMSPSRARGQKRTMLSRVRLPLSSTPTTKLVPRTYMSDGGAVVTGGCVCVCVYTYTLCASICSHTHVGRTTSTSTYITTSTSTYVTTHITTSTTCISPPLSRYEFATRKSSASWTHTRGSDALTGKYEFNKSNWVLTATTKAGKDSYKAELDVGSKGVTLEYNHKPFKVCGV